MHVYLRFDLLELVFGDQPFFEHRVGLHESVPAFAPLNILVLLCLQVFEFLLLHLVVPGCC